VRQPQWCVSRALSQIKVKMRRSLTLVKMSVRPRIQRAFLAWLDELALKLEQQRPARLGQA
jgi:hypothetical protein